MGLFIQVRDYGVTPRPQSNKRIMRTQALRHRETQIPGLYQILDIKTRKKRDPDKRRTQATGYLAMGRNVDPSRRHVDQTGPKTGQASQPRPRTW